jgi:hypothetical protein
MAQTAKEKVLSVYPDAYINKNWTFGRCCIMVGLHYFPVAYTENDAWQNALNELIKQGLCTE